MSLACVWKIEKVLCHPKKMSWYLAHIPKTGGEFLSRQLSAFILNFSTNEYCNTRTDVFGIVVLRYPEDHLTSQYVQCISHPEFGRKRRALIQHPNETLLDGFTRWIDTAWKSMQTLNKPYDPKYKRSFYDCYNPWNLQTRFLTTGYANVTAAMTLLDSMYLVVGTLERLKQVQQLFDVYNASLPFLRHNNKENTLKVSKMPMKLRQRMRMLISLDLQLYSYASFLQSKRDLKFWETYAAPLHRLEAPNSYKDF